MTQGTSCRTLAHLPLLALLVAPFLAGCGSESEAEMERDGDLTSQPVASETARTLDAPPDFRVGEWWTLEVEPQLVGATFRTTLVVTGRTDAGVTLGIPPEEFEDHFLVLHVPPLGDLAMETFAWRVMWDDFEALRFPLEEGRTWEADFHGFDVVAEVSRVEGRQAHVTMTGEGERIELIYDADAGMITEFDEEALRMKFRVVDHGFDYGGEVRSLTGINLGFMETGPALPANAEEGESGRSTSTVEVESGASHGSLSLVLWNVGFEDEPGRYRVVVTAPDGTVFEETFETAGGSPSVIPASFGHDVVDGQWRIDFERDGPGRLLVELFTYDATTGPVPGS